MALAQEPVLDPALDPAAALAEPAPPADPTASEPSLLASLVDPAAAAGNPQRFWQQAKPQLPRTNYTREATDEERKKVRRVIELFQEAREARSPMFDQWRRNYRALLNRNTPKPRRPDWLAAPEFPEILPIALTMGGWITDQRPEISITGNSVPHQVFAEYVDAMALDLTFTLNASYKANMEEQQINLAAIDAITYGTGIFKTTWDPFCAGGLGDGTFTRVSPFCMYPDPAATTPDDANYLIEARRMTLLELDRRYPGSYDMFAEGEGGDITIDEGPDRSSFYRATNRGPTPGAISPSTTPNTSRRSGSHRMNADMERTVTVLECWVREHDTVEIRDPRTGETTDASTDEWRVLVVANSRLIFEAHAHDLWDHGKHPYDRWAFVDLGDSFWGLSLVEMLEDEQRQYNRLLASFMHNAELVGNPILKRGRGKSRQPVTNRPGQIIETDPRDPTDPGWLVPPPLQTAMVQVMEFVLKRMEATSGLSAVVKGSTPSGRNAQGVVDSVQEAAFVRIRQNLRNLEWALRGVFAKKASLICSNYTTPRMVSIAGPTSEQTSITLKGGHFLIPTKDGRVPFAYQLNVDAGSQAHTSRAMREDRMIQAFTLGLVDAPAALEALQIPNWRQIAQRVEAKNAAAAQAESGGGGGVGARVAARA